MAEIKKEFPDIIGTEMISASWHKLLERDNSAQTQFSGTAFPDVTEEDIGRPCFRTDLPGISDDKGTWFIFCGMDEEQSPIWWDVFGSLKAENINIDPSTDFPPSVKNVDEALRFTVNKTLESAIVFPPEYKKHISDGVSTSYQLPSVSTNKNTVHVYLSGVLQAPDTYEISDDSKYIVLNEAPNYGEEILIQEYSSILEYDLMPFVKTFTGDGSTKDFDCEKELLNNQTIQVNIDGKILQFNEYSVVGSVVTTNEIPVNGASIQIQTVYKGQLISPTENTVATSSIQDGAVTQVKLSNNSVSNDKLADNSVSDTKIINKSIKEEKLADNSVSTIKIIDSAVEESKLSTSVKNKLLGNENVNTNNITNGSITKIKLGSDVLTSATTGAAGIVTLATKDEVLNGIGGDKVITADVLKQILDQYHVSGE